MQIKDFDYTLPASLIASEPLPRGRSRLLVVGDDGPLRHQGIFDLPQLLQPGDVMVVNNTRVIPARLFGVREGTGGRIELLLIEKLADCDWQVLLKPARRLRPGVRLVLDPELAATVTTQPIEGRATIRFSRPVEDLLARLGHVPLPPYIRRPDTPTDRERYQTVYASIPGAIAAPTAGLHFAGADLTALRGAGIEIVELTLHVGMGTFRPVDVARVEDHRMDEERYRIGAETCARIATARHRGGRVVAVGTTVVRALESAAECSGELAARNGRTDLFIYPGYAFRCVDVLLTNFHLPRSTLIMLVCAFGGTERVMAAYEEAIRHEYRFYSYGDAMLVERPRSAIRCASIAAP